jgi:RimJ/RimL family protein N-acetyltransferase
MTEPVVLRNVIDSDLPIFYKQQADPEANRMADFPARDEETFNEHWAKIRRDESVILQTILFNGQVAGNIVSFVMSGETQIGYWLGRNYWGKGIATQALKEFLRLIKTRPLYAHVAKHNIASRRVLEKCGFEMYGSEWLLSEDGQTQSEDIVLKLSPIDHA